MKKYELIIVKHRNIFKWPILLGEFSIKENDYVENWHTNRIQLNMADKMIVIKENHMNCCMFLHVRSGKIVLISNKLVKKIT